MIGLEEKGRKLFKIGQKFQSVVELDSSLEVCCTKDKLHGERAMADGHEKGMKTVFFLQKTKFR